MKVQSLLILLSVITGVSQNCFSQNVGVGNVSPTLGKLEVTGAVGITNVIVGTSSGGISFQRNSPSVGFNQYYTDQPRYISSSGRASVLWLNSGTGGSLYYDIYPANGTANAPALSPVRGFTISQNGYVSINAGEADATLFVGYSSSNYVTRFQGTTYHSEFNLSQTGLGTPRTIINGGKAGSDVYIGDVNTGYIKLSSYISINTTSNPDNSHLNIKQYGGHGIVLVEPSTFHNWEFVTVKNITEPNSDLWVFYNGSYKGNFFHIDGSYNPISDFRLKKDIQTLGNNTEKIMKLSPKLYKMRGFENSSQLSIGFIAQDVMKVFPELVERVGEGNTGYDGLDEIYTMNYDGIAPIVINTILEQQERIKILKIRNEELRSRIMRINSLLYIKQ